MLASTVWFLKMHKETSVQNGGSQLGVILLPKGPLELSTFWVATTGSGGCSWHLVGTRDTTQPPTTKKFQQSQGWETGLEVSSGLESLRNYSLKPLISCGQKSKHPSSPPLECSFCTDGSAWDENKPSKHLHP